MTGKGLTRREFIRRGAGAVAGAAILGMPMASCADDKPRKPNVIFLFADQMRNASLGCIGQDKEIRTPHMDKLAGQGMLFTNAVSGYPLCTPYRAMLLTGRYGTTTGMIGNGIELPDSEITIAKVLKGQGYKTGYIGKWHLEKTHDPFVPKNRRMGFDDFWASRNLGGDYFDNFYCGDTPEQITIKGYEMDGHTDFALDFIKKNKDQPFCLFVSWRAPHPPREAPKKYRDMYDPEKLTQRANVPKGTDDRKNKQIYNAMITDLDDNLGRITRELDELGIAEDTIICFSSDHGDMLASQGLQGKNVPYEESINIPFIMRYPRKIEAGQKNDALMNSVDVMPTLLGLCGVSIPKAVEGSDLSPIILGKGGKKPEAVLLQKIAGVEGKKGLGPWRGVRTARYTYARTRDKGYVLFDNEKDPYQMNNLIDKPEAKDLQDKMEAELQKLMKRIGDKFETQDAYLARIKGRVGRKWAKMQEASE